MIFKRIKKKQLQSNVPYIVPGVKNPKLPICASCLLFLENNTIICKMGIKICITQHSWENTMKSFIWAVIHDQTSPRVNWGSVRLRFRIMEARGWAWDWVGLRDRTWSSWCVGSGYCWSKAVRRRGKAGVPLELGRLSILVYTYCSKTIYLKIWWLFFSVSQKSKQNVARSL